jgi:glycosyltransferase involved in cell wall biosynthesis
LRPAVALISNGYAPYRERLLRRLAVELPEIELCNLYTHEESNAPWRFQARTETRPVLFGPGESAAAGRSPRNALHEWKKGGRILQWMDQHAVRGVVLYGYDDPGRLRVLHGAVRRGIPAFLGADSNIRNPAPSPMRALVKKIYVRHVVRRCAGILVFGELGRQYFQAYGAPSERIHLVPFEPDYGLLAKEPQGPVASAANWIRPGMRHLLYAGRLAEVKRPDLLLQAFAGIAAQRPSGGW